ncbi:MAG: T9SS type A sorting domain-containing protein [Bacteroidia bacterium]|nr:T9SS type A sorting domain-containing protein [Bacteroidia bacterium]
MKHSKTLIVVLFCISGLEMPAMAQTDGWQRKADFGGNGRDWAFSFSLLGKGYVGTGYDGISLLNDFWEYNPTTDKWTRKSNSPAYRSAGVGFSIGNFGYSGSASLNKDFWKYNPATNSWSRLADIPGDIRYGKPLGFSIGNFGYVGLGTDTSEQLLHDFWQYNPDSNKWVRKADFPSDFTSTVVAFSIGNKGYVGTGENYLTHQITNEFWEYNPDSDRWTQVMSLGFSARNASVGFSIGNKGYVGMGFVNGTGMSNDWWEYDPVTNIWTQISPCNADGFTSFAGIGFSVGNRGYVGTGLNSNLEWQKSFYEYSLNTAVNPTAFATSAIVYPNPNNGVFTLTIPVDVEAYEIYDLGGKCVVEKKEVELSRNEQLSLNLKTGMYYLKTIHQDQSVSINKFSIIRTN